MMDDFKCGVAKNLPLSSSSSAEENTHQFINLYDLRPYLPSKSMKNIVYVPTLSQQLSFSMMIFPSKLLPNIKCPFFDPSPLVMKHILVIFFTFTSNF